MLATTKTSLPEEVFAKLNREGPVPLYLQVAERLESLIADGLLATGARLENEIAISEKFNLSRPTIRRALQVLVDKGLLVRRRGVGTQVVPGPRNRRAELASLYDDLVRSGQVPTTEVLIYEKVPPSKELIHHLGVEVDRPVLHIRRLRFADGLPVALIDNHLFDFPQEFRDELQHRGLYEILRERGVILRVARQVVSARASTETEAKLLDLNAGSPILTLERSAFDQSGHLVEIGRTLYRPDRYKIEFTLVDK
jgi:DNA-binding GntR family transcriptional regulator